MFDTASFLLVANEYSLPYTEIEKRANRTTFNIKLALWTLLLPVRENYKKLLLCVSNRYRGAVCSLLFFYAAKCFVPGVVSSPMENYSYATPITLHQILYFLLPYLVSNCYR